MKIKQTIKKTRSDFLFKTLLLSAFSIIVTFVFAVYNLYLGIKYGDAFALGISIYYILLVWVKSATLIVEKVLSKKDDEEKKRIRQKNYKISSVFVFVIDFCLIAPILLMVIQPKEFKYGIIPAIAMATYSVYKISSAIYNYKKAKISNNLTNLLLRKINVIDALVSILSLQRTLIMVNGGMGKEMQMLSFFSSIGIIILIIIFSIVSYIKQKDIYITKSV